MGNQPQPQQQPRRRRRPALSCRECRRRKIKCDHNNPCAHCVRHKTQCVYNPFTGGFDDRSANGTIRQHGSPASTPPPHHASSPSVPDSSASQQLAHRREGNLSNMDESIFLPLQGSNPYATAPPAAAAPTAPAAQNVSISAPLGRDDQQPLPDQELVSEVGVTFRDLLLRIQRLEESSASGSRIGDSPLNRVKVRSDASTASLAGPSPGGTQEWQAILNKSRDWGRSRWMGAADEFAAIIACYSEIMGKRSKNGLFQGPEASGLISQAGDLLRKCKNRARSIKTCRPTRGLSSPHFGFAPPCRETADAMVNLYFASFESTYVYPDVGLQGILTSRDTQISNTSPPHLLARLPKILG